MATRLSWVSLPSTVKEFAIGLLIVVVGLSAAKQLALIADDSRQDQHMEIARALAASAGIADRLIDCHTFKTIASAQPFLDTLRRVRQGCHSSDAQAILTRDIADLERMMAALREAEQFEGMLRWSAANSSQPPVAQGKLDAPLPRADPGKIAKAALRARHLADALARQMHDRLAPPDQTPPPASAVRRPDAGLFRRGFSS